MTGLSHRARRGRGATRKSVERGAGRASRAPAEQRPRRDAGASARAAPADALTVRDLIHRSARRISRAKVFFGHGTANALDDAAALVLHAARMAPDATPSMLSRKVNAAVQRRAEELVSRRIEERIPAVYLTGQTWFAGLPMFVDSRVLIPRSPIAELIERQFMPWIDPSRVTRVVDIGTGSGCIAIACAKAFPKAKVDAVDISDDAMDVARINVRRHRLGRRVRVVKSDHFRALGTATYDIIVANPPYVGAREMRTLPPEYRHEPRMALAAGPSGLGSVRVILQEAAKHLRPRGILVVEVGNTELAVQRAYRNLPFTWLDFARGGGGVFLLTAQQLAGSQPRDRRVRPRRVGSGTK